HLGNGDPECGPCRGLDGILGNGGGARFGDDDTMDPTTFCRSDDGPEVPDIGDLVQEQEKGQLFISDHLFDQGPEIMEVDRGNLGHNTLVVASGQAVQFLDRHIGKTQATPMDGRFQFLGKGSLKAFLDEYFVDGLFGGYCFQNSSDTIDLAVHSDRLRDFLIVGANIQKKAAI